MIETKHIQTQNGNWSVLRKGEAVCIVDEQGRERHRSNNHDMTAVHLAMRLMDMPFESTPNVDEALRRMAQSFRDESEPPHA